MSYPFTRRNHYEPTRSNVSKHQNSVQTYYKPIKYNIKIVSEPEEVNQAAQDIRNKCRAFPVIGLDCEWTAVRRKNEKPDVALLQIATRDGCCVLFRTCFMEDIGESLLELLLDSNILKVGVGIFSDVKFLQEKFKNVKMKSTFDIRYLTRMCNIYSEKESLGGLTKALLHFDLKKENILEYDWKIKKLKDEWIQYAALDAIVAVRIFEKLLPLFHEQECDEPFSKFLATSLISQYFTLPDSPCHEFLDRKL